MQRFSITSVLTVTVCCLSALVIPAPAPPPAAAQDPPGYFQNLKSRLVAEGFDRDMIAALYTQDRVQFDAKGIAAFFTYSESRLNYDQFTSPRSIKMAQQYAEAHGKALSDAERRYGVDRHVITAIILVETRLGTYLGDRAVVNTLSTMASLSDPTVREAFWGEIPAERRITRENYEKKAHSRSKWAYEELKAFLQLTASDNIDPCSVNGSFAGAMGIAQFMPSNILTLAQDGNGDGKVDLFDHPDAIASVANYLKHHGWRAGLSRNQAYKILLSYNYSKPYANCILDVAERLKG